MDSDDNRLVSYIVSKLIQKEKDDNKQKKKKKKKKKDKD